MIRTRWPGWPGRSRRHDRLASRGRHDPALVVLDAGRDRLAAGRAVGTDNRGRGRGRSEEGQRRARDDQRQGEGRGGEWPRRLRHGSFLVRSRGGRWVTGLALVPPAYPICRIESPRTCLPVRCDLRLQPRPGLHPRADERRPAAADGDLGRDRVRQEERHRFGEAVGADIEDRRPVRRPRAAP